VATGPFGGSAEIVRVAPRQQGVLLAATGNGLLYRSRNGGASWDHLAFPAQLAGSLHALEADPGVEGVWYAGMESDIASVAGVYKTSDGGLTWTQLPGLKGKSVWAVAVRSSQPRLIAAGTTDGVYLSRDGGASWARISPESNRELRPVVSLAFHPTDPGIIYAGTTHLPWRTRDGGAHWESIHSGMIDDSDVFSISVETRAPSSVFASACSGVYRSSDGGSTWKRLATPSGAFRTYLVALDPHREGVVYAATSAGLLRSSDRGGAWKTVTSHQVRSIAFDAVNPNKVYFASATGGLLVSRDSGNSLVQFNAGFANRNFAAVAGSGGILYASTVYEPGSGGIFRTSDRGARWARMASPGDNENIILLAATPDDPDNLFAAGRGGLYRSTDGAKTWSRLPLPQGAQTVTALLPLSRDSALAGTTAGLFRLESGSWAAVSFPGRHPVELLQNSGKGLVAAISSGSAFRSQDGGSSWTACGQPAAGTVWYGLTLDSGAEGAALAATSQGLFRSTDQCATWDLVRNGLDQATVSAVVSPQGRSGEALAAQFGRVFITTNGGLSWRPIDDAGRNGGYPSSLLLLPAAPRRVYALFPRRGVLSVSIEPDQHVASTGGI
jgi:photosystem II stability/assembly factor-like uncharacterized protein